MNTEINDGGPAFPVTAVLGLNSGRPGLSMRDYFAAKAMQGLLANPKQDYAPLTMKAEAAVVEGAYGIADAMIKAKAAKGDEYE